MKLDSLKVAIVHDDLVQWGGAERVLLAISELFPNAPIYTSVFNSDNRLLVENFGQKKIVTSFMQKIPGFKSLYQPLLPVYPLAFEQFDLSGYDLVISQTTKFAKSIITKPGTIHVCYCHTPPRFLWKFSGEQVPTIAKAYVSFLRGYDQISSQRVDKWLAGSLNCQSRIKKVYRAESEVLQPFIDPERFAGVEPFDGGYYLVISRLNNYKRVDIAVDAFNNLEDKRLKIVGVGPRLNSLKREANSNIEFVEFVNDEVLTSLIAGCKALIVTAEEDFGLTPLEAQSCGKPVIAYGVGGAKETIIDGKTGVFFYEQTTESLKAAIDELDSVKIDPEECVENAKRFSKEKFLRKLKDILTAC